MWRCMCMTEAWRLFFTGWERTASEIQQHCGWVSGPGEVRRSAQGSQPGESHQNFHPGQSHLWLPSDRGTVTTPEPLLPLLTAGSAIMHLCLSPDHHRQRWWMRSSGEFSQGKVESDQSVWKWGHGAFGLLQRSSTQQGGSWNGKQVRTFWNFISFCLRSRSSDWSFLLYGDVHPSITDYRKRKK